MMSRVEGIGWALLLASWFLVWFIRLVGATMKEVERDEDHPEHDLVNDLRENGAFE